MNFGRLESLEGVDLRLPMDHSSTASTLKACSDSDAFMLYLGATGWSNPEWRGSYYPIKLASNAYLGAYGRLFGTIEFNTTHYRIPTPEQVSQWAYHAPPGFRFCPKLPQQISHHSGLRPVAATRQFCESLAHFADSLGPCFIQLPERFGPENHDLIKKFLEGWPSGIALHWEFRHASWFQGGGWSEKTFEALQRHGHGIVITDVAGRRDVLHMRLTVPDVVVRFVGNGLHHTDYQRVNDWVSRLKEWKEAGLKSCYFFVHQHEMTHVPQFAAWMAEKAEVQLKTTVLYPKLVVPPPPPTLF